MNRILALGCLFSLAAFGRGGDPPSPIEKYRSLKYPPTEANFELGWKERVAADYEVINSADLPSLRAALKDASPFVRAITAYALGVRGDKDSADSLAELVRTDKDYVVRIRAIEALGLLKMKPEIFETARKDRDPGVPFVAKLVAGKLKSNVNYAAEIRRAYAGGIDQKSMGLAVEGKLAPDFSALKIDGGEFQLSSIIGKKPIAIYFAAFDG